MLEWVAGLSFSRLWRSVGRLAGREPECFMRTAPPSSIWLEPSSLSLSSFLLALSKYFLWFARFLFLCRDWGIVVLINWCIALWQMYVDTFPLCSNIALWRHESNNQWEMAFCNDIHSLNPCPVKMELRVLSPPGRHVSSPVLNEDIRVVHKVVLTGGDSK